MSGWISGEVRGVLNVGKAPLVSVSSGLLRLRGAEEEAAAAAGRIRARVIRATTYSAETVNENMRSLREEKVLECEIKLRWV